jgi:hypothetical protein
MVSETADAKSAKPSFTGTVKRNNEFKASPR